jgi:ABC-type phosphate transport system substrate-binding protein
MSNSLSGPARGLRPVATGLLALLLLAFAAATLASKAHAEFSLGKCEGSDVIGQGSSFQKEAQKLFNEHFANDYCVGTPGQGLLNVTYEPTGSGAGIKSMELRTGTTRFGGTDDPPTPAQVNLINSGAEEVGGKLEPDKISTDDGKVHVVPVAVGAVAPLVNFPDGCNPEQLKDEYRTVSKAEIEGSAAKKALLRVRMPKALFEKIWAFEAGFRNWNEAFPELTGAACEKPIMRVVRFDQSGSSFAFKDYLSRINPARGWLTTYATGPNETKEWPGAEYGTGGQCGATAAPGKQEDSVDHLTSGCANGNGALVPKLQATDGSIGYSDLATARSLGTVLDPTKTAEAPTTPYWTQVQNGNGAFTEPTFSADGFETVGQKGSNCKTVEFTGIPANTLADWSKVSGVNSKVGYGICTLTYALLFDDNAAAWGASSTEEAKARTVKDYWENVVGPGIQGQLFGRDYAALPESIRQIAQTGVNEIGWEKSGEVEKEKEGPKGGGGSGGGSGSGGAVTPPSNQFTLTRKSISSKTGGATISVKLPGAGKLDVLGQAKVGKKKITVGHVALNAGSAGTFSVTLKPSAAAKKVLNKEGKLKVTLKLTFTPNGGTANTSTSSLTLKLNATHGSH